MMWLAIEMNGIGLLPDNVYGDITDARAMLTETQKAIKIVSALEMKISMNPYNLDKFLEIVKKKSTLYEDIITKLSST